MKTLKWILILIAIIAFGWWAFFSGRGGGDNTNTGERVTVNDTDWIRGSEDAPVTLVEYGDFQCPACGQYHPLLKQLEADFEEELRVVFRHFPLVQIHQNALFAATAAEAAGRQGKFWEMHDLLFENQELWAQGINASEIFNDFAEQLELDLDQFATDLEDSSIEDKIRDQLREGNRLGVNSTPTFYLNGERIQNPPSYEAFAQLIEAAAGNDLDEASSDDAMEEVDHEQTDPVE